MGKYFQLSTALYEAVFLYPLLDLSGRRFLFAAGLRVCAVAARAENQKGDYCRSRGGRGQAPGMTGGGRPWERKLPGAAAACGRRLAGAFQAPAWAGPFGPARRHKCRRTPPACRPARPPAESRRPGAALPRPSYPVPAPALFR